MGIRLKIGGYVPRDPQSYRVEYWYNRHERAWVVQVFDNYDSEHDTEYCPNKAWRDRAIEEYCEMYSTRDVRKV